MTRTPAPAEPADDRARIDAFVRRHYSLGGTWRLHRHALGLDLLRAPANVLLAPWALALRLAALACSAAGARGLARRLARRPLAFRSDMGRAVETALLAEVVAPRSGAPPTDLHRRLVADYVALRSAIAEIATTLAVVALGIVAFHALTPGVLSLAPVLTDHMALAREIAAFPLGDRLGAAWYGLFPAERPLWHTAAVAAALILAFSLVTTFAGLLADPLQARLGIHRRRLIRLLARLDRADDRPGIAREVVIARLGDIADAGTTLARFLRH
jgi:hypothetical protein